jgi:hypothetical protein
MGVTPVIELRHSYVGGQKFFHKTFELDSPPQTRRSRRLRGEEEEKSLLILSLRFLGVLGLLCGEL